MKIRGQIIRGLRAATGTIAAQKQYFRPYINDIDNFHNGTINLLLEDFLFIKTPEIVTRDITWGAGHWVEKFGFQKIKLQIEKAEPGENEEYDAYIYIPFKSPHRYKVFQAEIIAPFIELGGVTHCNIIFDNELRQTRTFVID